MAGQPAGGRARQAARRVSLARQGRGDIKLGLSRMEVALAALGHPERAMPPVIHVAGTNGKGSTLAYLRAILEAGGYGVHAFTSPAILSPGEQIVCDGTALTDAALDRLADEVEAAAPGLLTPFETLTACAFLAFSRAAGDLALIETGMGGAGDATNVIARPALTLLTPIALDHMSELGHDLAAIARIKAGIFKAHVPAVVGPQEAEAVEILEREGERLGVRLIRQGTEWMAFAQGGRLVYQDEGGLLDLPLPALAGRHQLDNAGLAIAAVRALGGLGLSDSAIEAGLSGARWPARLEPLRRGALIAQLPAGSELWLDVGHNPHAAAALAEFLADREEGKSRPLILVTGMLAGKDASGFFKAFAGLASRVLTLDIADDPRAENAEALAAAARGAGHEAAAAGSLSAAMARIAQTHEGPVRVLLCGSFSVARLAVMANG
jgi:dihydrofolate synthase/folylpolyglutamate synthase